MLPQVSSRRRIIVTRVTFKVALSAMHRSHVLREDAGSTISVFAVLPLESILVGVTA